MKKQIKYLALAIALALTACFDDKGNYDYATLQDFYVDTTGIRAIPLHPQFDTLRLPSRLVYAGDKSDLSFAWTIYLSQPPLTGNPAITLAETEDLAAPIAVLPSNYWIEFRATENTGRIVTQRYPITVESSGSGLLVLHEHDGIADLDLVKTRLLTGNLAEDNVMRHTYSLANPDHPLTGNALSVDMFSISNLRFISIYTDEDGVNLSPDDMSVTKNFRDLFLFAPRAPLPQGYFIPYGVTSANPANTSDGIELLVSDGVYYTNMALFAALLGGQAIFSERTSTAGAYYAAPFPFYSVGAVGIYDQLNRRFMTGSALTTTIAPASSSGKFNIGDIGKDLVHLAYGFNGQYMIYAIFKNPVDNGQRYLYVINFSGNQAVAAWDISAYTGIANARLFAYGRRGPTAFYAAGNTVYRIPFDLGADTVAPAEETAWSAPAGEEITTLELCAYPGRDVQENTRDRYLFVGTYNNATTEGKLYIIQINITTGACTPQPVATFGQFGKIKDIAFKY